MTICNEQLLTSIAEELCHIGLFTPVSEIENTAIKIYAELEDKFSTEDSKKSPMYIRVMTNAVCAEILAKSRLPQARNGYEASAVLSLLQGYIDTVAKLLKIDFTSAHIAFKHYLPKEDWVNELFVSNMNGSNTRSVAEEIKKEDEGPHDVESLIQVITHKLKLPNGESSLCFNNMPVNSKFESCCGDCEYDESICKMHCDQVVTVNVCYKDFCAGYKICPELFQLDSEFDTNRNEKVKAIKQTLQTAHNEFSKYAEIIYAALWAEHHNYENNKEN